MKQHETADPAKPDTGTPSPPPSSLPVYNPIGGGFLLLHWWTYDDRGHVVLSRRETSILAAVDLLLDEHPDAEIKAYLDVEIVAPSHRLCGFAADAAREREISFFRDEIIRELSGALKLGLSLPAPFSVCASYEPEGEIEQDEWARERHYDCRNCKDTIVLGDLTPGDLFVRYGAGWRKLRPFTTRIDKRVVSRAPVAKDDEPLWYAYANFGHHAGGVELREVDFDIARHSPPDDVLFFFRRLGSFEISMRKFNDRFQDAASRLKAERERDELVRRARSEADERREAEEAVAFFRERTR